MSLENTQAQVDDQALQFKKRARRRLVGAIALVLIMVAVLPMVLDDRAAKQPQQEIAISIPSQESTDFSSKVVPVAPANPSPNSDVPVTQSATSPDKPSATQAQTPTPVETSPAPIPPAEKKPLLKEDSATKPSESNPAKTADDKATEKQSEPKVAPKKDSASKDTTNKEKPKASDKSAEKSSAKSADASKTKADQGKDNTDTPHKIVVQIGVFSDANNVKQMQQKLSQAGIKAYTEQLSTDKGEKTRLRVGPYANRQEAESALEKVKSLGMPGMVITK